MADQAKNKLLTFILSMVPGVGHYYLGLMNRGLQFMLAFFGGFILMDLLSLQGLFAMFLPVIWFYALFDALQMATAIRSGEPVGDVPVIPWDKLRMRDSWIGWGLVTLGAYMIFKQILPPLIPESWSYRTRDIQTAFLATLLIFGGIRILIPRKERGE